MKRNTTIVAAAVAMIAVVILGASALYSWAVSLGASPNWRLAFRMLCHGMPDRSLELFGVAMPICARCTAIYLGLLLGLFSFLVLAAARSIGAGAAKLSGPMGKLWLLIAVAPLAVDGITQALGLRESVNPLRIATGLLAGAVFGYWVLSEVEHQKAHTFSVS